MHDCKCVFVFFTAIREFPNDIFTNAERKSGAVLLHIMAVRKSIYLSLFPQISKVHLEKCITVSLREIWSGLFLHRSLVKV